MTDRAGVLVQLARSLARHVSDKPLPNRLCLACVEILGVDGAAITLAYTKAERVTLCATDSAAGRLEDLQEVLGQGPGRDAYTSGRAVSVALANADAQRWPMFTEAARSAVGDVGLCALPMTPQQQVLGVLTVYQRVPRPLSEEIGTALFLADALGAALLRDPDSQGDLRHSSPWAARAQIHQATGMVVAQLGITTDDAIALLRAHAFAHDTTVDSIAAAVVGRRLDFTLDDDGDKN